MQSFSDSDHFVPESATHYVLIDKISHSVNQDLKYLRGKITISRLFPIEAEAKSLVLEVPDIRESVVAHGVLHGSRFVNGKIIDDPISGIVLFANFPAQFSDSEARKVFEQFGDIWYVKKIESGVFWVEFYDSRDASFAHSNLDQVSFHGHILKCRILVDIDNLNFALSDLKKSPAVIEPQETSSFSLLQQLKNDVSAIESDLSMAENLLPSGLLQSPVTSRPASAIGHREPVKKSLGAVGAPTPPGLSVSSRWAALMPLESDRKQVFAEKPSPKPAPILQPPQIISGGSDNQINLQAILSGSDMRTTFMIRNIPNKYSQQMLIDLINETHRGKYDFLYLRMDFKNKCNVGYAFVNFPNPMDAASFAVRVSGKKWRKFNSEKVCTMSYANIQGLDALVTKFRDSQVMLEDDSYRPKLFDREGNELEFPAPLKPAFHQGKRFADVVRSVGDSQSSDSSIEGQLRRLNLAAQNAINSQHLY